MTRCFAFQRRELPACRQVGLGTSGAYHDVVADALDGQEGLVHVPHAKVLLEGEVLVIVREQERAQEQDGHLQQRQHQGRQQAVQAHADPY